MGKGKYDDLCTYVRKAANAKSVILIVFKGEHGDGFSVQATGAVVFHLPKILRETAQQIEDSFIVASKKEGDA